MTKKGFQNTKKNHNGKWLILSVTIINLILFIPILLSIIATLIIPPNPGEIGIAILEFALGTYVYIPLAFFNIIYFIIILFKKHPHGYLKIISYFLLFLSLIYLIYNIPSYIEAYRPDVYYASSPTPIPEVAVPIEESGNCKITTISEENTLTEFGFSFQYPSNWTCYSDTSNPNLVGTIELIDNDPAIYKLGYNKFYDGEKENFNHMIIQVFKNVTNLKDFAAEVDSPPLPINSNTSIGGLPAVKQFRKGFFTGGDGPGNYAYPYIFIYVVHDNFGYEFQYDDQIKENLSEDFIPSPDILSTIKWVTNP